jgi:hypothetical protein
MKHNTMAVNPDEWNSLDGRIGYTRYYALRSLPTRLLRSIYTHKLTTFMTIAGHVAVLEVFPPLDQHPQFSVR